MAPQAQRTAAARQPTFTGARQKMLGCFFLVSLALVYSMHSQSGTWGHDLRATDASASRAHKSVPDTSPNRESNTIVQQHAEYVANNGQNHERHVVDRSAEWDAVYYSTHPNYDAGSEILPNPDLLFESCTAAVQQQEELHEVQVGGYSVLTNMPYGMEVEAVERRYKTIVLTFHGCMTYYSMWQGGASERAVATQVSDAGGLMLVFQTTQRRCWDFSPHGVNSDIRMIVDVLHALIKSYPPVADMTLSSIGISGGSRFVTYLSTVLNIKAMVLYISLVEPVFLQTPSVRVRSNSSTIHTLPSQWRADGTPTVLLVYMPLDPKLGKGIPTQSQKMMELGIPSKALPAYPWEITSRFFHLWMPTRISRDVSVRLFDRLAPLLNGTFKPGDSHLKVITKSADIVRPGIMDGLQEMFEVYGKDMSGLPTEIPSACCRTYTPAAFPQLSTPVYASNGLCHRQDWEDMLEMSNQLFPETDDTVTATCDPVQLFSLFFRHLLNTARSFHEMTADHAGEAVHVLINGAFTDNEQ